MDGFHDLHRRVSRLRDVFRVNSPNLGHMTASLRIADGALARQLIALLTVFAPALTVALPRNHHAAGPFPANITSSQAEVDHRQHVFDAFRLMLDAAGVECNGPLSTGKPE